METNRKCSIINYSHVILFNAVLIERVRKLYVVSAKAETNPRLADCATRFLPIIGRLRETCASIKLCDTSSKLSYVDV